MRVGNGRSIRVWGYKWLNMPSSYCAQSLVKILRSDARVGELIDHNRKWWNEELVNVIFDKEEAGKICSIPFNKVGSEDKLIWGPSKRGTFFVRSAYFVDVEKRDYLGRIIYGIGDGYEVEERLESKRVESSETFPLETGNELLATRKN